MIRIEVPATSANLGSGFDALGIALNKYNRVWMEEWDSVEISSVDNTKIPTDTSNLIFWAANYLYESCGHKLPGLKILQENNIPMARGLGSSSACIVAGILGANRMLGNPLSQEDLINLAAQIEGHPDNTSPAIAGGLVTSDGFVVKHFPDAAAYHYPAAVVGAILVVLLGWIFARRAKERAKGRPAHQVGGGTTS